MQKNIVTHFLVCLAACLFMLPASGQQKTAASKLGGKTTAVEALLQSAKNARAHRGSALGVKGQRQHSFKSFGQSFTLPMMRQARAQQAPRLASSHEGTELWGVIIARDSWKELDEWDRPLGVYSLTSGATDWTALTTDNYYFDINAGGAFVDGYFYGCNSYSYDGEFYYNTNYVWNTEDWEQDYDKSYKYSYDQGSVAYATAYDPTDKKVYAFLWGGDDQTMNFGTIDFESLEYSVAGQAERLYVALAINAQGEAYAIGLDGNLYKIDKSSGASTLIGSTGVKPSQMLQSATFDLAGGTLYWAAIDESGASALYTVATGTATATKELDFADGDQVVCLYAPQQSSPKAPSAALNLAANFAEGSLTGTVSFDIPTTCSDGSTLSGTVSYTIYDGTETVATGTAEAGASVEASVSVSENGEHTFSVILSNESGESKKATITTGFLGMDEPTSPDDVTLTISETGHVKVTWSSVTEGYNEGYVDPEQMSYRVTRNADGTVVAENLKATEFEEDIDISGTYTAYSYSVVAICGSQESPWGTRSNIIKTGKGFEVPYKEDFAEVESINLFETVNYGTSRGWGYAVGNVYSQLSYRDSKAADAWLITPPIALSGQRAYYLRFTAKAGNGDDDFTETVSAAYGQGTVPTAYTEAIAKTSIKGGETRQLEQLISIDESGDYRFGIHDTSSPSGTWGQSLYVDDIEVVEGPLFVAPDSVTALTAKGADKGLLSATVSFKAPSLTFNKQPLSAISKIEVACDGTLAYTFSSVKPGEQLSCTISNDALTNGFHTFTVTAYNADGEGLKSSVKGFVGIDVPMLVQNLSIKDNLDGTATMTWNAPSEVGQHGNYVDTHALTYNIYTPQTVEDQWGDTETTMALIGTVDGCSYTIEGLPTTGTQGLAGYAVAAVSVAGEGGMTLGTIAYGSAYELPFHEGFPEGNTENALWITTNSGGGSWGTYDSMSSDGDGGCAGFIPSADTDSATMQTGKIALGTSGSPKLKFTYYALTQTKACLTVRISKNGSTQSEVVKTIDMTQSNLYGWQTVVADLTPYVGEGYVNISFCAKTEGVNSVVVVDDISVKEFSATDVSAMLKAPTRLNVGATGTFTVGLSNVGTTDAEAVKVTLYKGTEAVDEQTVGLAAYSQTELSLHYKPLPTDEGPLKFHAVAELAGDENLADNQTDTASVALVRSELPAVTDLSGATSSEGQPTLSWSQPDLNDGIVTDGFETYEPFAIEGVGDWTLIDGDGQETTSIMGASSWKHSFDPYAYIVFNPEEAGLRLENLPQYGAHGGDQYMAAFECNYNNPPYHNDDWLISPQLSGKQQTISFFAKSVDNDYCFETFEVLYTTGEAADTASYVRVGGDENILDEWQQYEFDLPEGATHFAIRCLTKAGFIFMVDDVTYQGIAPTVKGYNVYRDGQLIATTEADATSYTDTTASQGDHTYAITVVYDEGESDASNTVSVSSTTTAISGTQAHALSVVGGKGFVRVSGIQGETVKVHTASGALAATVSGQQSAATIALQRGQYVVSVGSQSFHVGVK